MAHRKGFRRGTSGAPGGGDPGMTSTPSSGGGGGGPHGEGAWSGPTYSPPKTVTYTGPSRGEGVGSQTFNKNLRTIQRRHDYNRLANQRAHPFLSKLGGIGGLLKGIGKGALSFFGGIPGKALSGIMTASDYAKRKGSGVLEGIEEFSEHDNLMSYLNRNKVQAIQPIESMPTNQEIIGQRVGQDQGYYGMGSSYDQTRMPENITTNMGANNQMVDPNFLALGAAEGGRIGFKDGKNWYDRVYPFDIMPWPLKDFSKHFGQVKGNDPSTWFGGLTRKTHNILTDRDKRLKLALENKADGGIARLL